MRVPDHVAESAEHLILIARQLRSLGDIHYVHMDENGVGPYHLTLAGELELIAMRLDWDGVMARCREED